MDAQHTRCSSVMRLPGTSQERLPGDRFPGDPHNELKESACLARSRHAAQNSKGPRLGAVAASGPQVRLEHAQWPDLHAVAFGGRRSCRWCCPQLHSTSLPLIPYPVHCLA